MKHILFRMSIEQKWREIEGVEAIDGNVVWRVENGIHSTR